MTTKGRTVLKIGLFGMIAGTLLLAFGVMKTEAIGYGGIEVLPDMISSTGLILANSCPRSGSCQNGLVASGSYYYGRPTTVYNIFGQFIKGTTSTGKVHIGSISRVCNYGDGVGIQCGEVAYVFSGSSLWREIAQSTHGTNTGFLTQEIFSFSGKSSGFPYANDFVVGIFPQFIMNTGAGDDGFYLFSENIHIYSDGSSHVIFDTDFYDEQNIFGIKVTGEPVSTLYQQSYQLYGGQGSSYILLFAPGDNSFTGSRASLVSEFTSTLSGISLQYTLPSYYGASGFYTGSVSSSGSSENIDYFADCESFIDVGCYVQGVWNGVVDGISNWFVSLFPDVTWSGGYNTCFDTGSTSTGSNLTGSGVGYIQKLANFGMVIIPLAPPDGTQYCMIGGFTGTLEYQKFVPEEYKEQVPGIGSIFDVMMLLLFGLVIISSIHKHSGRGGGGHGGDIWHDAEDIKTVVHKPF